MADTDSESTRDPPPGTSQTSGTGLFARRRSSLPFLRTKTVKPTRGNVATFTPPDTPTSPVTPSDPNHAPESLFHNYLRAFHPFDPSPDDEASSITVPIRQGDLILVHSVHANGWADGTLLSSGIRGWLPTNYCSVYDHAHMRNLLNAMTQFWDLLGDGERASFSTFVRQDYVRGLIAGVRYLLERTDCLHRGAALVLRHMSIRRIRKGLLADLSSMVQKAKELQEEAGQPHAGEVIHIVLDELVAKAFKVVTRAMRFMDVWTQETSSLDSNPIVPGQEPPTPPIDQDASCLDDQMSAQYSPNRGESLSDDVLLLEHKTPTKADHKEPNSPESAFTTPDLKRRSAILIRNSTASHRLSLVKADKRSGIMASEQLAQAHDVCISHMGQFLGHHMQSRSPAELFENTQRLVDACKTLVAIMNQVQPRATGRVASMHQSQTVFHKELSDLVRSTKEVFTFSDLPEDGVIILPDQITRLVANGTRLIRAVGECVANTRRLLEKVGDFELEKLQIETDLLLDNPIPPPLPKDRSMDTVAGATQVQEQASSSVAENLFTSLSTKRARAFTTDAGRINTQLSPSNLHDATTPTLATSASSASLPLPMQYHRPLPRSPASPASVELCHALAVEKSGVIGAGRKDSVSTSITDGSTTIATLRDSEMTMVSEASTRATTPDQHQESIERREIDPKMLSSFGSISSITSVATDGSSEVDGNLLLKSYAHELILNQHGQISGGSLQALVEQLTSHDTTPDPIFSTTFYQTFRMFSDSRILAQTLIERFDYIGDSKTIALPVRLRICNFFKGWLENHWNAEVDRIALGDVRYFAVHKLRPHLPSAAERLLESTRKVTAVYQSGIVSPISVGRAMTFGLQMDDSIIPESVISKAQLNLLRNANLSIGECSVIDMDPLEVARQLTLIASRIYRSIQADELFSLSWNKKGSTKGTNVRSLSKLNNDLSFIVKDSILASDEIKKRASIIKHWVKVGMRCLELNNFESLLAIVASLMCSHVARLKKTWEIVSKRTKARFDEMKVVTDPSGNNASLRRRMEDMAAPCVPFMGVYLTDLTFIDVGNPATRPIPNTTSANGEPITVINFDKYARMSKVVTQVQRFQSSYNLLAIPELQTWLDAYLNRPRDGADDIEKAFALRSLALEPRQNPAPLTIKATESKKQTAETGEERPKTSAGEEVKTDGGVREQARFIKKYHAFGFKAALSRYDLPLPAPLVVTTSTEQHDAVEGASR